ncbi:MFS transporter [Streptomyces rubellomurinus]|uniref:Purine efflux pump PbuE n=1 Tax=Streptomyces rubellomurinus (strain ATCC 31215) TaxID=359131 RepID=A0A0F2THA2_STRR3|nr:MFS transporter [Streptomyces rubellomurinus]KJS61916.1 purine efflux pump PbuE [Streptomyces rubellomurinus]
MPVRLLLLALGTFAVGTDSMVIAGILGPVSTDLGVSVGVAGQLVTVFALGYALLAPPLAAATARWPRRTLLLTALAVFSAANALSALAPTYPLLLATRVLAAAGAALYTPTANAVATTLVAPERRGRALATVLGGMTVATALGVPLGTWVGRTDWRLTMWLVTALGLAAFAGLAVLLRDLPAPAAAPTLKARLAPLGRRQVLGAAATTLVFFLAFQCVYIYLATAVAPATGGDADRLSLILFTTGVMSVLGSWLGGRLVDRLGVRTVLFVGSTVAAAAFAALPWLGRSMAGSLVYAMVVPLAGWAVSIALPHRLASIDPANAPLLISLNSSALYLGTAAGGAAGSAAMAVLGTRWFPLAAAVLALVACATAAATTRDRRAAAVAPAAPAPATAQAPATARV